jgi:hypothetical protein
MRRCDIRRNNYLRINQFLKERMAHRCLWTIDEPPGEAFGGPCVELKRTHWGIDTARLRALRPTDSLEIAGS